MPRIKQNLQIICFVSVSLFITMFFFEIFLRAINYNYSPLRIEVLNHGDWRYYHAFEDHHFVYDPYLIWRPKQNYSVFNSQGYRGKELAINKEQGEFRIFAIGDSNTLGWDRVNGPNWPAYLEELLMGLDKRYVVINAGVWDYSSFQGLRRFKEVIAFSPDMVLISFGGNDALRVPISDVEFMEKKFLRRLQLDKYLVKLKIGQLTISFYDKFLSKKNNRLVARVSLEEYKDNLNEIIEIAHERGIEVILLTRPFIGESSDKFWKKFASYYGHAAEEVAELNRISLIDICSYSLGKKEYFTDEAHFTEAGHRYAAKIIYEYIAPIVEICSTE